MGGEGLATCVLDTGALIAIDRFDQWGRAFLRRRTGPIVIPATVLAQAWRDGGRQARLAEFLTSNGVAVEALDELTAKAIGSLLGRTGTSDVVDASVVISARRHRALVLTTDPADLLQLDPRLEVEAL